MDEKNIKLNSFKCSVHPILQIQEICEKEIVALEKEHRDKYKLDNNISTVNTIRCVSKLFYKDGSGDPLLTANYLKSVGIKSIPILNFRGNRFNTLFHNAAGTFFIKKQILNYLCESKTSLNFTQNIIVNGLKNEFIVAVIHALGIIFKLVTDPYMKITMSNSSVLEVSGVYSSLIDVMKAGSSQPDLFLKNQIHLICGPRKYNDEIESSLFDEVNNDEISELIIKRLCSAVHNKCLKTYSEYLEGGIFFEPQKDLVKESEHCPQNNITVERLMAKLDSGLKSAPNINTCNLESRIMFKNNDTGDWLIEQNEDIRNSIIENARMKRKAVQQQESERKNQLFKKSVDLINERKRRKIESNDKKQEKEKNLKDKIDKVGCADNESEIRSKLEGMNTKRKN
ncbi:uncharacterized protein LOC128555979 [Mercenaria mercenaria]|uniref:uncharacterized protein LOC128555979 n=1 Tax=Mercenaria mercenaria TaxID=6596 RepID=UPI00234FA771|nr:uncharacterized protein LOC128555979 [Mercenaria mercenaria]